MLRTFGHRFCDRANNFGLPESRGVLARAALGATAYAGTVRETLTDRRYGARDVQMSQTLQTLYIHCIYPYILSVLSVGTYMNPVQLLSHCDSMFSHSGWAPLLTDSDTVH